MTWKRSFRLRGVVLVLIAVSSWPLQILTINLFEIARPERIVGLIGLIWIAGMLLVWIQSLIGIDLEAAENSSFIILALAMNGGAILREFGVLTYAILIVCPVLVGWLSIRIGGNFILASLIWGMAVALAAGPILMLFDSWNSYAGTGTVDSAHSLAITLEEKPDIFLVVFDGYPGMIAGDQDQLSSGDVDVVSELRHRGFQVPESSWSSYWTTTLSIPSLLNMNYPVVDTSYAAEKSHGLREIIAGENALVEMLSESGYTTHMVESGWSTASCGSAIDHCVPAPLLDQPTYLALRQTIAWLIIEDSPGPWVLGAQAGFEWLLNESPGLSASSEPDFVFMHVVSPHPPFLLKSDCSVEFIYERTGAEFNLEGVSNEDRERYLIGQMDCMDRLMLEVADAVDTDDIVIYVSDHGTDRRHQANSANVDWDHETIVERLNTFLAVRLPSACTISESVVIPNLNREVLDCLSPATVERLPERIWINPMDELDRGTVEELMSMRAG